MNHLVKFSAAVCAAAALAGCGTSETAVVSRQGVNSYYGCAARVDMQRAIPEITAKADSGDPEALFFRGEALRRGLNGIPVNPVQASAAYRQALPGLVARVKSDGDPLNVFMLGEMLAGNLAGEYDPAAAAELYRFAAERGFAPAKVRLGAMLVSGEQITADWAQAETLLKEAAGEMGEAWFELYKLYKLQGKSEEADAALKNAVRQKVPEALYLDALAAESVPARADKAPALFRKAAQAGSPGAAKVCALRYADSREEKLRLLQAAAADRQSDTMLELARSYAELLQPNRPMAMAAALIALRLDPKNQEAGKFLLALNRETGLLPVTAIVWNGRLNQPNAILAGDVAMTPALMHSQAGLKQASLREWNYLLSSATPESLYLSNSFYQLWEYQMPLEWLAGLFAKLDKRDALGAMLQYTAGAGLAGQGRLQSAGGQQLLNLLKADVGKPAAQKSALRAQLAETIPALTAAPATVDPLAVKEYAAMKPVLQDIAVLCIANGKALAADQAGAYVFLTRNKLNKPQDEGVIAFVNKFCGPLLFDKAALVKATGLPGARLGAYSRPVEQKYFSR